MNINKIINANKITVISDMQFNFDRVIEFEMNYLRNITAHTVLLENSKLGCL